MTANDCRICRDIPDHADWFPAAAEELVKVRGGETGLYSKHVVLECPLCRTLYEHSYAHYPGDGYTCDPHTDETLARVRTDPKTGTHR